MSNSYFCQSSGVKQPSQSDLFGYVSLGLTGQSASIGTTNLVASASAGVYRVSFSLIDTTAGSAGTVTVTIGWNNGSGAQTNTSATLPLTGLGGEVAGVFVLTSAAAQAITYATTVTGAVGSPIYALNLRLEYLG